MNSIDVLFPPPMNLDLNLLDQKAEAIVRNYARSTPSRHFAFENVTV